MATYAMDDNPTFKEFKRKCYSSISDSHGFDNVQKYLKKLYEHALESGTFIQKDWSKKKIPDWISKQKKRKRKEEKVVKKRKTSEKKKLNFNPNSMGAKPKNGENAIMDAAGNPEVTFFRKNGAIIGSCTKLEKNYLRMNFNPDPSTVRPQHILEQAMEMIRQKFLNETVDYNYISDQFKSIRQDLTIQNIWNEFTVRVYESHARYALRYQDIGEFNQCQSRLKLLYARGLPGNHAEFVSYRLMYHAITKNYQDLASDLKRIDKKLENHPFIVYAHKIIKAVSSCDLYGIFHRLNDADSQPIMAYDLLSNFSTQWRVEGLKVLCRGNINGTLPLQFVAKFLGMEYQEIKPFLSSLQASFNEEVIDCKETYKSL